MWLMTNDILLMTDEQVLLQRGMFAFAALLVLLDLVLRLRDHRREVAHRVIHAPGSPLRSPGDQSYRRRVRASG